MPRKRLTDEERAERKRKAWDPKQFKKSSGVGNEDQWKRAAEKLLGKSSETDEFLRLLGLSEIPTSLAELKKARRLAMQRVHPDVGGTEEDAQALNVAFDNLKKIIQG